MTNVGSMTFSAFEMNVLESPLKLLTNYFTGTSSSDTGGWIVV
jgi:hypothetical protein